jgi:Tfp pilus assembly protein PilX
MQRLMNGLRDESGVALITALLATVIMLALGLALLSIVDTQANDSGTERTRDRGFNLAESVLNSEAFVLGRNWPSAAVACNSAAAEFGTTVGAGAAAGAAAGDPVERLRPNINESYTDAAYAGASWKVDVCDDTNLSSVWDETYLTNPSGDSNANNKVWVRAQSIVGGKKRVVAGLVTVVRTPALNSKYGLVAGNLSEDLSSATAAITNAAVVTSLTSGLLTTNPPVAPDDSGAYPVPASGVTGVRCGLLENVAQVKTCITGAIGALSSVPAVNTLVTQGKYEQFPTTTSTSAVNIAQLRSQAKSEGVYMATAPGASTVGAAPSCAISGAATDDVVFIEKVGTGDQYCYVDVGTSVTYKALVIGSGRVIIRGNNSITPYATTTANRFTGVVYALNLQTADLTTSSPTFEIVRIEKGARVKGAVHADGKNATVGLYAPDFSTDALVDALIPCTNIATCALRTTLKALGVTSLINTLTSGSCLLTVIVCVVPGPSLASVVGNITSQLTAYGSAIHNDVATVNNLTIYGASGVTPASFRDLNTK